MPEVGDRRWNINKRKVVPPQISRINWENNVINLEQQSRLINDRIQKENINNDQQDTLISSTIDDVCRKY